MKTEIKNKVEELIKIEWDELLQVRNAIVAEIDLRADNRLKAKLSGAGLEELAIFKKLGESE